MSGRKIDDHSFWAKGAMDGSVFPKGVHVRKVSASDSAGSINSYQDTEEKIRSVQAKNVQKIHSQGMKEGYRN